MRKNRSGLLFKKMLKTASLLLGAVLFVYAGFLLKDIEIPTVLPVSDIQVSGDLRFIDSNEIKSMVKQNISGGYFTVDLQQLRELVMQRPWVKQVSLRRKWPAGLMVSIDEEKPVAYWNDDGYISDSGDVFKPAERINNLALPALYGPMGKHKDVWKFMNVLYSEMALLDYSVVRLDLDERRAWQMVIVVDTEATGSFNKSTGVTDSAMDGHGVLVKLGRFETEKRLQRFVRIIPVLLAENTQQKDQIISNTIKVVDMRYPNGFAVQMNNTQMSSTDETIWNTNEARTIWLRSQIKTC